MRYRRHLFVCTHTRDGGGKPACGSRACVSLINAIESELARRGSGGLAIAVTACGCLGPCFDGPNAVVYPDGVWLAGLVPDDAPAVVEYLLGGPEPAGLRYDWSD